VQLHAKKIHLLTAQGNFSLVLWVGHKIILLYLGLLHFTFLQTSFYVSLQFVVLVCCDDCFRLVIHLYPIRALPQKRDKLFFGYH
jgi:hypothetical protein